MSSSPEAMSVPEPPARTASESSSTPSQRPVTPHAHSAHGRCPATGAEPHDYCPPQRGDSRSPCPALNTLANHGYLPRDGKVITPSVLIHALREGYHLSYTLAWFLTHGGFYLLGQRRKRICLQDLSRHNCIEHDASLVHPDVGFRDEYAPIEMHLHMLEDLMRYSKDGVVMTPDDVARARVAREAAYTIPMDKIHAEIARGEMAIVLQLFNNPENYAHPAPSRPSLLTRVRRLFTAPSPSPPPPAPLPGVPNHMLRVFMHEERLPDGWTPYHRVGLLHTMRMATRLRRSMRALQQEDRKAGRARTRTVDGALAALIPALTIAAPEGGRGVVLETGDVGGEPLCDEPACGGGAGSESESPTTLDTPRSTMTRHSTLTSRASSDGLRTPVDVSFPVAAPVGNAKQSVFPVQEEEGVFERIRERTRAIEIV